MISWTLHAALHQMLSCILSEAVKVMGVLEAIMGCCLDQGDGLIALAGLATIEHKSHQSTVTRAIPPTGWIRERTSPKFCLADSWVLSRQRTCIFNSYEGQ